MDKLTYNNCEVKSINTNPLWEKVLLDVSDWIKTDLTKKSVYCNSRFKNINHPLVSSGDAFWEDNKTLCVGYRLKSNYAIIRNIHENKVNFNL